MPSADAQRRQALDSSAMAAFTIDENSCAFLLLVPFLST
jgi:hypothetical protein